MPREHPEEDDRYRRTLDSLIEGFQIVGHDWTYLYVNPAAAGQGQKQADDLHGRKMWEAYPGIEQTPIFGLLARCMTERTSATVETLFTFPDGRSRWFEVRIHPVPEGLCVQSLDIQDRKDAEAARDQMARRVREQAALARIGELATVVVHEVKNPLAAVRGAIQVIGSRVAADEAPIVAEIIARLDSLNELINDLLLFARPPRLRLTSVDIAALLQNVVLLLRHDPAANDVTVDLAGSASRVVADGDLLSGVFLNLLLNAAQAMQGRGTIRVTITQQDGICEIVIADNGPGIPTPMRAKLFTPFFTTKARGTGLGLATARRIVEAHNGTIAIDCPTDGGTRVTVRVPTAAAAR